ncbi:MAG: OmpA family protein [Psychrobium sp.]
MLRQIQFKQGYAALSRRVRELPMLAIAGLVATLSLVSYSPTISAENTKKERTSHGFVHLGAGASALTPLKDDVKLDTENNIAWQFGGGWQFNQYFAIEGYYANLDKYEISNTQSIDYRSIGVQLTGYWPVTENGRLLAFVGGSELDTKGHNVDVTQVESNSVHLGAGFEYDWDAHWFSRIQWTTIDEDADMFTVHFGRRFGIETREKAAKPAPIKPTPNLVPKLAKVKKEVVKPVVEKVASTRFIEYVGFDHDEQGLDATGREQISRAIELMKASPSSRAVLFGHTYNVGNSEYNFKLSLSRANNIRDMLTAAGIDNSRIRVKAYGDTAPIASNNYFKGRVKNRRVEVMIIE